MWTKLESDRRLLEAEVRRDPGNAQAVFRLAQITGDLGDQRRAIDLYQQRAGMGGCEEEAFYAAYQVGALLATFDWDKAVPALLHAWQRRPTRAEPLHRLSFGYRCREQPRLALFFAERGLRIPAPDDTLLVERHVYDWGLLFEWSVAAAQLGDLDGAIRANQELLARPLPDEMLGYVHHNHQWCLGQAGRSKPSRATGPVIRSPDEVRRLQDLVPSMRVGEIRLAVEPAWPQFNPSIAVDGAGFRMIVRTASLAFSSDAGYRSLLDDGTFRTLNYLVELDGDLQVRRVAPVVDLAMGVTRYDTLVRGYEDCRLVKVGDRWFAIATVGDHSPVFRCQMVVLALTGDVIERVIPLPSPDPGRHEKNWMPVASGGDLHLIYSCDPTTVLRCDTTTGHVTSIVRRPAPPVARGFRGGSQGVAVEAGTLAVVHEVTDLDGRRRYTHRFVLFGGDYEIKAVSPRFCFDSPTVEFCAGLARRDGQLLMTFGIAESAAHLAVVKERDVLSLLVDAW